MSGALTGSGAGSSSSPIDQENADSSGPELSPLVVEAVGRALHAHFRAIAELPLPDRLLVLLAELEAREQTR